MTLPKIVGLQRNEIETKRKAIGKDFKSIREIQVFDMIVSYRLERLNFLSDPKICPVAIGKGKCFPHD
ncbi:CLUMA_CG006111, isoform A [Clunio marinus]|uniref:CLUMA_CG006111, isoform A n=1 Tax=Clunio marinus TaxID=568069 RepID=A0A1J1HYX3_9DIPT|nr:CLUMA_CG006111, isoform A [Clunio marinus]